MAASREPIKLTISEQRFHRSIDNALFDGDNMTTRNATANPREAPLQAPSHLDAKNARNLTAELNVLLADVFAIYIKTKNFHWHVSGPHFRDYHLLLDEQADQLFAMTDDIAERVRKLGGTTIRSIGHLASLKHVADNDAEYVGPLDMIGELREDNHTLAAHMIGIHDLCNEAKDVATESMLENWIDQTQCRVWFLFETSRTTVAVQN
jgi:starvation-inducible DNA-binding protein